MAYAIKNNQGEMLALCDTVACAETQVDLLVADYGEQCGIGYYDATPAEIETAAHMCTYCGGETSK